MAIFGIWLLTKGGPFVTPALIYLAVTIIYIYPIAKSFGFSNHAKAAMNTDSSDDLAQSFSNLRGLATFMGVLYILGFIGFVIFVITAINAYTHVHSLASGLPF